MKGRDKLEVPEKTSRPTASFGTISTYRGSVTVYLTIILLLGRRKTCPDKNAGDFPYAADKVRLLIFVVDGEKCARDRLEERLAKVRLFRIVFDRDTRWGARACMGRMVTEGDADAHVKCSIALTPKVLNWRVVFSWCCVYRCDSKRGTAVVSPDVSDDIAVSISRVEQQYNITY
ncbi:hypothetical protein PR048_022019 [Dryococelus australis]|uniref:Uncharacterized protein n=1 Tax=Dryococelus australis TaxID=614101 RepID=A0ABQ9GZU9_9NEOP|nr:hypothetical protein PR048_022019 [Dryococelus australis]